MNWLIWRQHRKQFLILGIILAGFTAFIIPTGLHNWHVYRHVLSTCASAETCAELTGQLFRTPKDTLIYHFVQISMLVLPVLFGAFWGVPLIAREYAAGTNKLVWTQSISRRKWLSGKLLWISAVTTILASAFAALVTWWSHTFNAIGANRFEAMNFSTQGLVPAACTVFALALGIFLGAWFKRTLLAIGVTMVTLIVVQMAMPTLVRPHYVAARTQHSSIQSQIEMRSDPLNPKLPSGNQGAWVFSSKLVNSHGQTLDWHSPPHSCIRTDHPRVGGISGKTALAAGEEREADSLIGVDGSQLISLRCINSLGYGWNIKYQPAYRYWNFQRIEAGLYLALAALPVAATYWLVLKRDA
ncbi:MAG TPA: ABC transporter permease subunit [Bacillota bacterium]|nr:ABC transporter permease subunit [Bacillota bacterium]